MSAASSSAAAAAAAAASTVLSEDTRVEHEPCQKRKRSWNGIPIGTGNPNTPQAATQRFYRANKQVVPRLQAMAEDGYVSFWACRRATGSYSGMQFGGRSALDDLSVGTLFDEVLRSSSDGEKDVRSMSVSHFIECALEYSRAERRSRSADVREVVLRRMKRRRGKPKKSAEPQTPAEARAASVEQHRASLLQLGSISEIEEEEAEDEEEDDSEEDDDIAFPSSEVTTPCSDSED